MSRSTTGRKKCRPKTASRTAYVRHRVGGVTPGGKKKTTRPESQPTHDQPPKRTHPAPRSSPAPQRGSHALITARLGKQCEKAARAVAGSAGGLGELEPFPCGTMRIRTRRIRTAAEAEVRGPWEWCCFMSKAPPRLAPYSEAFRQKLVGATGQDRRRGRDPKTGTGLQEGAYVKPPIGLEKRWRKKQGGGW